jgi:hypothetical protein
MIPFHFNLHEQDAKLEGYFRSAMLAICPERAVEDT